MPDIGWSDAPSFLAGLLAALVEGVEALTIVLAAASVRGWRVALFGAGAAGAALLLLVIGLGPAFRLIPVEVLQVAVGLLLLLFGMRWLRKGTLRAAGLIPLHDEDRAFATETSAIRAEAQRDVQSADVIAFLSAFKGVLLEGIEVVFIVVAVSTGGGTLAAGLGAAAGCVVVIAAGVMVHRPLSRIPENVLKLGVGILLSAFGTFWIGEGLGFTWPGGDLAIAGLAILLLGQTLMLARLGRRCS